jgi:ABC-type multidrug transport system fused ATPase/permease subunit
MTAETTHPIQLPRSGRRYVLRRCLSYLRPYWLYVAGAYALLLVNNGASLAMPLIIGWIVDQGIRSADTSAIAWGVVALMGVTLARGVAEFFTGRWTEVASQNVAYDMRNLIHRKLQSLSFSYHDQAETGQLLTRAIGDVDRVRFLTGRAVLRLIEVSTLIIGIAVSMLLLNTRLALLTLITVPFLAAGGIWFGMRYRPLSRMVQQQMANVTTRLEQNLRGARIVKAFAQEGNEIRRFED